MKKVRINNQITVPELRVVGAKGENLGVLPAPKALERARAEGLDLIEIVPSAKPPVAKIMDYGKYQYQEERKERKSAHKVHETELKGVRVGLGTSEHDLEMKAQKMSEFLKAGHRIKIDLMLRGREKYLDAKFLGERLKRILKFVSEEYKLASEPKKGPRGIAIIIEKK